MSGNYKKFQDISLYIMVLILTVLSIKNALTFEIAFQEPLVLKQTTFSFFANQNPLSKDSFLDQGIVHQNLLKVFMPYIGEDFRSLRFVSILFFFLFLILNYNVFKVKFTREAAMLSTVFLGLHYKLFDISILISPYSMSMFFIMLLYRSHFSYNYEKKEAKIHAFLCLINIAAHFTASLPVMISLYILYIKNKKANFFKRYIKYYIPFLVFFSYKIILVFYYRFIFRKPTTRFYDEGLIFNIKKFLYHFDYYFSPGELIFSQPIPLTYQLATIFSFIVFSFYLLKLVGNKKFNFLKIYLLSMTVSYFLLNILKFREISTRYYYGLLPLLYIYISHQVCNKRKKLLFNLISISFVVVTIFIKVFNVQINFNHMLREPIFSMQKVFTEQIKIDKSTLVCSMPSINVSEYIHVINKHDNFNNKYKDLDDSNFDCNHLSEEKLLSYNKIFIITIGEFTTIDGFCENILNGNCSAWNKGDEPKIIYSRKSWENNFGFNIFMKVIN